MNDLNASRRLRAAVAIIGLCAWSPLTSCGGDDTVSIGPLASGVAVTAVKVLQGTTVAIAEGGVVTSSRAAPVVESRPGRIRVFIEPTTTLTPRDLMVVLTLQRPGSEPDVRDRTQRVITASAEDSMETTFNFDLDGSAITTDLEWKASVHEVGDALDGDTSQAMLPRDGTMAPMGARSMGGVMDIVLVPARYTFDGSSRVPDTSAVRELFRRDLYPQFPVSSLNITVRRPFNYDRQLTPEGLSWGRFLDAVLALRRQDGAPASTYYYGIIVPTEDEADFCAGFDGCIAGVGPVPSASDTFARAGVGLGYLRKGMAQVFTHEMGHVTGRLHAPCGRPPSVDDDFPHGNARLGASGYDFLTETFYPASETRDFMSYCGPPWVSDYTYAQIFDRLRFVNNVSAFARFPARQVRAAIASDKGAAWGHSTTLTSPSGEEISVDFEDASGHVVSVETAQVTRLSHGTGVIYWIPEIKPADATHVRLPNGQTLPL